jgi:hypothetical protein
MPLSLTRVRHLAGGVAAGAALVLGAGLATASTASAATHATVKHQHCAILLAPVRPHQSVSRVRSYTCSTQQTSAGARPLGFPAASVPIITIYQYTNFTGQSLTFYGDYGPCNAVVN